MVIVPVTKNGPDMDVVEELVKDPEVKGVWCVLTVPFLTYLRAWSGHKNKGAALGPPFLHTEQKAPH